MGRSKIDTIKNELRLASKSWHVEENIDELILIYEARIKSLKEQVDALVDELKHQ